MLAQRISPHPHQISHLGSGNKSVITAIIHECIITAIIYLIHDWKKCIMTYIIYARTNGKRKKRNYIYNICIVKGLTLSTRSGPSLFPCLYLGIENTVHYAYFSSCPNSKLRLPSFTLASPYCLIY